MSKRLLGRRANCSKVIGNTFRRDFWSEDFILLGNVTHESRPFTTQYQCVASQHFTFYICEFLCSEGMTRPVHKRMTAG